MQTVFEREGLKRWSEHAVSSTNRNTIASGASSSSI